MQPIKQPKITIPWNFQREEHLGCMVFCIPVGSWKLEEAFAEVDNYYTLHSTHSIKLCSWKSLALYALLRSIQAVRINILNQTLAFIRLIKKKRKKCVLCGV